MAPLRRIFAGEHVLELLQPFGLTLWDFGESVTVVPMIDHLNGSYLTSSMIAIVPMGYREGKTVKVLAIEWWRDASPSSPVILYAAKNFATLAIETEGGKPFPLAYTEDALSAMLQAETKTK